ncbi:MAG: nuclear transport factor 2 family protein, partial [Actinomycetes bacterium]
MNSLPAETVAAEMVAEVHQLYGHQSHRIDGGDAAGWAATFTPDGVFDSPTYPQPVVGAAALEAFAHTFAADARAAGEVRRHVVSTLA